MSLVITSNISLEDKPDTSEVFKPYSYQNQLLNTMRIPANSEVALHSVKINKNGLAVVDRANANFNHYFGVPVGTTKAPTIEHTTQTPFPAVIGKGQLFNIGGKAERNVVDLAKDIESGINVAAFNPSLIEASNPKNITCEVFNDPTTKAFKGYKWITTQNKVNVKRTGAADASQWTDISVDKSFPPATPQILGTAVSLTKHGFHVMNKEYPISQSLGTCFINFGSMNGADGEASNPWVVGLSRINMETDNGTGNVVERPPYWSAKKVGGMEVQADRKIPQCAGQSIYADISVYRQGKFLYVGQSGVTSDGTGTQHNQIKYWGDHSKNFAAKYDLSTNLANLKLEIVQFKLDNEHMEVSIGDAAGNYVLLADFFVSLTGQGAGKEGVKGNLTAPICAPKMALYPVAACGLRTGKSVTMVEMNSYINYPKWDETLYLNYDWWGYSQSQGLTRWCLDVEKRFWNNIKDVTSGILSDGLLVPVLTEATGELVDYQSRLITVPSIQYGAEITANATTARTLGFVGNPVSSPTVQAPPLAAGVDLTQSFSVPVLVSDVSLFVRLNNFTQNSINARQGTISKIVGHLPRFDNSGNETGGLFFEPASGLTYIALNNPNEILINSFDVDIVYDNETLCTALSGKTIVVFHIRKEKV
tara:strand:- start:7071 stop:9014 length:1944 start_codon:yes stop_codon:yes gene_type:complete